MLDKNMKDNIMKGSFVLSMYSDGDFVISDIEGLKETGWHVISDDDPYNYTINLYDFVGTGYDLRHRINEVFIRIHSSRIYIMREICDIFEAIENNCVADEIKQNLYFDHGNQTYEANFNFASADEIDIIRREITSEESKIKYYDQQIEEYNGYKENSLQVIEDLKSKLQEIIK